MAVKLALLLATLVCSVTAQCNTPWEDCGELLMFGLGRLCQYIYYIQITWCQHNYEPMIMARFEILTHLGHLYTVTLTYNRTTRNTFY